MFEGAFQKCQSYERQGIHYFESNRRILRKSKSVAVNICQHPLDFITDILNPQASFKSAGPADHKDAGSFPDEIKSFSTFTFHLNVAPELIVGY